jgi:hypothetical protein
MRTLCELLLMGCAVSALAFLALVAAWAMMPVRQRAKNEQQIQVFQEYLHWLAIKEYGLQDNQPRQCVVNVPTTRAAPLGPQVIRY